MTTIANIETKNSSLVSSPKKMELPLQVGYTDVFHTMNGVRTEWQPDTPDNGHVPLLISYDDSKPIANSFSLLLTNINQNDLLPVDGSTAAQIVYVSFVFDDSNASPSESPVDGICVVVSPVVSGWQGERMPGTLCWKFWHSEEKGRSKAIMTTNETVRFFVSNVVIPAQAKPGMWSMNLQFTNVAGYNDASYTLLLEKQVTPAPMVTFTAKPDKIMVGENVPLTLTWAASLAQRVTLQYANRDGRNTILDSDKNEISFQHSEFRITDISTLPEITRFTFTAYGIDAQTDSRICPVIIQQPVPAVVQFQVTPSLIPAGKATNVRLTWEVRDAVKVTLETSNGKTEVIDSKGSRDIVVNGPQRFRLRAYSYGTMHPDPVLSQLRVYTYQEEQPVPWLGDRSAQKDTRLLAGSPKSVLYLIYSSTEVFYYDVGTRTMQPYGVGYNMALSEDGDKFFMAFPSSLVMYNTGSFKQSNSVSVGTIFQILPTPDNLKVYCSVPEKNAIASISISGDTLSFSSRPMIGVPKPQAMIFNKDASKLYSVSDSPVVNVINVATDLVTASFPLQVPNANRFRLAYDSNTEKLYVISEVATCMEVIDTINDKRTGQIQLEIIPSAILKNPGTSHLYVAGMGRVIVIDTTTDKIIATLPVGEGACILALNKDNNVLFVSSYYVHAISVIDLVTLRVLDPSLPLPDRAVDMAVLTEENDNVKIFVAVAGKKPAAFVYNLQKTNS